MAATATSKTDPNSSGLPNKVLPQNPTPVELDRLFNALKTFSDDFTKYVKNSTTPVPWGRARLMLSA